MSHALDLVGLLPLMRQTSGRPEIAVGLIDGPVALDHPDLATDRLRALAPPIAADAAHPSRAATRHGTFVAGILSARRSSAAPAICPDCSLLVRPIFPDARGTDGLVRSTPAELARAIDECVDAGARVLNVSAALTPAADREGTALGGALDRAARRGTLVVVAAGNDAGVGGSPLTNHPWVIPVAACTRDGRPSAYSTFGLGIGRRGLSAPGDGITSLSVAGDTVTLSGTSAAAPFVTGALALLWSASPRASAHAVRRAVLHAHARRASIVPPLLNAWASHLALVRS